VSAAARELERAAARAEGREPAGASVADGGTAAEPSGGARRAAPEEPPASAERTEFARVSRALLAGFPDHVAWRMDAARPHCAMPGRRKVVLERDSVVRGAGFLLALEIREGGRGDQRHQSLALATPLERAWVEDALPACFEVRRTTRLDEETGAAAEFEEEVFAGIVVARTVRPLRGRAAVEAAHGELAARLARGEIRPAAWDEAVDQWIARVRCVAAWCPERPLTRYDEEDLAVLAAEIADGCERAADLDRRPVLAIIQGALEWSDQQWVERMAPAALALPSGHRMRLTYEPGKPPVGRAKIQDFYDFKGHPMVAGGRVKVRLELLGPNFRPVQITDDLPGFWERLYPEVKKELKRRYPRHEWR
jgi:ATP-dependent helicase HrpB